MNTTETTRVLLVEDHAIVRQGLRSILEREPGIEVVGEAADGRDAIRKVATLDPDVVLMDITMPRMNGIDATAHICKKHQHIKVLALTMHTSEEYVYSLLQAGARGYVLKDAAPADLLEAIRVVGRGGTYLHPQVSMKVMSDYLNRSGDLPAERGHDPLTHREREVLQLITEGSTNKEIARHLTLSVKTVEAHRTRIMDKLKIHNVVGLTRYAISHGITSVD